MYSYKFKDSGYRTQFLVDINNFIMFISESVPCSDKTDGKMLEDIKLEKYIILAYSFYFFFKTISIVGKLND